VAGRGDLRSQLTPEYQHRHGDQHYSAKLQTESLWVQADAYLVR
jgi:hypothetical protein